MQLVAAAVLGEAVNQTLQRALAKLRNPHSDSRDSQVAGERNVVETGERDVLRDPLACRAERLERADRHIVVGSKDGVELGSLVKQLADRRFA